MPSAKFNWSSKLQLKVSPGSEIEIAATQPFGRGVEYLIVCFVGDKKNHRHFGAWTLSDHFNVDPDRFSRFKSDALSTAGTYAKLGR